MEETMKKTMNALTCAVFTVLAGSALLFSSCTTTSGAQAAPAHGSAA